MNGSAGEDQHGQLAAQFALHHAQQVADVLIPLRFGLRDQSIKVGLGADEEFRNGPAAGRKENGWPMATGSVVMS